VSTGRDDVAIRDARSDDRAAVEAVTLAAYEQYAAVLPPPLWAAYRQNIVTTLAEAAPTALIVAEPEVRLLAVGPAGRGRGVGRRLMVVKGYRLRLTSTT
jgi:GNAT superfamily N-acetyltransferase